jgi:N-acetylmuramoyl-L-alanine amidase
MRLPVIALAVVLATLPPGGSFVDDDGSTHEGGIEAIAAAGLTAGCNPPANDRYCPDANVTREQMAAFIARARQLAAIGEDFFTDDEGHLFERSINSIARAGITLGCNPPVNDEFCPDRAMTRGEMAAMLARAFAVPASAENYFLDDDGNRYEDVINRIARAGITVGCNPPVNDRFCPSALVTRAQMATFLTRSLGLAPNRPPPRPNPVLTVIPREDWGALPPRVEDMAPHTIDRLTIHHAGTQSGVTGPAQIRGWQDWHMNGHRWPDLAYHIIIGVDGRVYEGRDPAFRADTGTSYDTTGHLLVVVEGNFELEEPTAAQWTSLEAVLAWASQRYEVSPETISGHGDHAATLCPGRNLESRIDSGLLAADVQRLIDSGGVDLIWP